MFNLISHLYLPFSLQQQEDYRFLSHFGGKFIVHQGSRHDASDSDKPALYQIRAYASKLCRRVVQVGGRGSGRWVGLWLLWAIRGLQREIYVM